MTKEELREWAGVNYTKWIALAVTLDSYGAYKFLVENHSFRFRWSRGTEREKNNTNRMQEDFEQHAKDSGNPLQYALVLNNSLAFPNLDNEPLIVRDLEKLLRNNP